MSIRIAGRTVGPGEPLFVIAEIGLNHGGSPDEAVRLVDLAAEAGASAVKLQTLHADTLVAGHCPAPAHVQATSLRDFFRQFELDEAAHRRVFDRARARGLTVLSTPFDEASVDLLARLGVDAIKIASGDLTHHGLIRRAAATGRPVVLSTGMSSLDEVRAGVAVARSGGASEVAVLHCVSCYPVPEGSENLAAIQTLRGAIGVPVGLSDHGTTPEAIVVATSLGASLYERHFIGERDGGAIDAAVSSTPRELARAIAAAERARRALGDGEKRCLPAESVNRRASRRGLYARRDLGPGMPLRAEDLVALRPADGICADAVDRIAGADLRRAVKAGAALAWDDIVLPADNVVPHAV